MKELDFDQGWGRFPRELFKYQAKLKLHQYEGQILRAINCFIVGHSKYDETISVSQLVEMTGIDKRNVNSTVNSLIKKKAIEVKENRYRLLFTDDIKVIPTDDYKKIKVMWSGTEYICTDDRSHPAGAKSHPTRRTPKTLSKDSLRISPKKKENFYKKVSGKEISKLELDPWYKAIMYNEGGFSIFYIQGTIDDFPFNTRMSCWYLYQEASNVRDKEAYFSHLLRDYREEK